MASSEVVRRAARRVRDAALRLGAEERRPIPLWDGPAPGEPAQTMHGQPTFSVYLPPAEKRTGEAVVVCPGGGYSGHAEHEAAPVGRWLSRAGIVALVLRYRLAPMHRHPAMLEDALQAVKVTRALCPEWGIRTDRVGILGFSAGGHLAAMATYLGQADFERPDFAILIYPVVCMVGEYAHAGCRAALLGSPDETAEAAEVSVDLQVKPGAPPCFIVHGADDEVVDVRNSLALASACRQAHVRSELHVYASGPHGFGLGERGRPTATWPRLCLAWIRGCLDAPVG